MNRKRINNNNIILNHASLSHYKEFLIMHALRNHTQISLHYNTRTENAANRIVYGTAYCFHLNASVRSVFP